MIFDKLLIKIEIESFVKSRLIFYECNLVLVKSFFEKTGVSDALKKICARLSLRSYLLCVSFAALRKHNEDSWRIICHNSLYLPALCVPYTLEYPCRGKFKCKRLKHLFSLKQLHYCFISGDTLILKYDCVCLCNLWRCVMYYTEKM